MKKINVQIVALCGLFTLASAYSYGQDRDTLRSKSIEEVSLTVGSRNKNRVATDTPVPVDVINVAAQGVLSPQTDLNQILNFAAPSFTSNTTTVADGTDHIDPAQLRGLGPDQVLVLLNGKRRHTSSLVNINGSPGRGSVGTDLNAIPAFSIERLEVLRDGASAQYGSDAIAGVINVVMKKATNQLTAALTAGSFNSKGSNDHNGGWDGDKYQIDLNYGAKIGSKGFINFTGSVMSRGDTRRAKPRTGNIFNAYNAVEQRALANGVNISSLFENINNTPNTQQIINNIHQYAAGVTYFTAQQQADIQNATTISGLQSKLGFDVTENELTYRGLSREDFNMRVGQSKLKTGQLYVNSEFELGANMKGYVFGGYSYKDGNAAGFYRLPNQSRTATSIFPNGFLPEIASAVIDKSLSAGLKGKIGRFNYDLSNTFGQNTFDYTIKNTVNTSLNYPSKTSFNAGGLGFSQNTINLDMDTKVDWLQGLNLAFGAESRFEYFSISQGEESSYALYNIYQDIQNPNTVNILKPTDFFGNARPGGAQVFPGFRPENAVNKDRTSVAVYSDNELDVTDKWLVSAALRFENYSDFGSTFNYKIATRYKITDNINFRGAHSTGFRAPSLHQISFNSTSTQFVGGTAFEVGIFSNDSKLADLLGITKLKQERSTSYSAGFTAKVPQANLTLTLDGYYIKIKDRITLTDQFSPTTLTQPLFTAAGATAAAFFANAIDTQTKGIEGVVSQKLVFSNFKLNNDLAVTVSTTERVGDIHSSTTLKNSGQESRYFSEASRIYLQESVPRFKASLINVLEFNKLSFLLKNVYFGKVTDPNTVDVNGNGQIDAIVVNGQAIANEHPIWAGKMITDLSVAYKFTKQVSLTVGANNLLDIYPDENYGPVSAKSPASVDANGNVVYSANPSVTDLSNANQFVYSRNTSQFGQNGRFLFVRANLSF